MFENSSTTEKGTTDIFYRLLIAAKIFKQAELDEAVKSAKRLDIPLSRMLVMLKMASDNKLRDALQAEDYIRQGKVSFDIAVKAIVLARQNSIDLIDAINVAGAVTTRSQTLPTIGDPFAELLATAELITAEQLMQASQKSKEAKMSLGRTLVVSRFIPRWVLAEACTLLLLVKHGKLEKKQAVFALKSAVKRRVSVTQILFETGEYHDPSGDNLDLAELLYMAAVLPEIDFWDCLELEISKKKSFAEVLSSNQIVDPTLLDSACQLHAMIGTVLKPFQAAEVLKNVRHKKISMYQAMAELQPPAQIPVRRLSLSDLAVESGVVSREAIDALQIPVEETAVRAGKRLLAAGLLVETTLYYALRAYSLAKEGMVAPDQAVQTVALCKSEALSIEEALARMSISVPGRTHWNWT